jgi:hypothetical protein
LKQPIAKENVKIVLPLITGKSDRGFQTYVDHALEIDSLMDRNDYVESRFSQIIFRADINPIISRQYNSFRWEKISSEIVARYPTLNREIFSTFLSIGLVEYIKSEVRTSTSNRLLQQSDWDMLAEELKNKYSGFDCGRILLSRKMKYYSDKQQWLDCAKATLEFIDQYGNELGDKGINDNIWNVIFLHTTDKEIISEAIATMKVITSKTMADSYAMDTYANLLYKAGNVKEAKDWELKAIFLAESKKQESKDFKNALEKMRKGIATWQNPL